MNFITIIFAVLISSATVINALNPCKNQENGKMVPYKNNPYNYLLCENNDSILMICEDGEKFNKEKGECNKKQHLETNVTINDNKSNEKLKKFCEHLSNGIKLPYSKNCEEYYVCYNNIAHLRRCDSSLYYSSRKAACVRKEEAECDITNITELICKDKADGTMLSDPNACNKFYVCAHHEAVEKFCPGGLHFSPSISVCTYPEDAGCETSEVCKDKPNGEQLENPRNCSKYYTCFQEEAKSKECPHGLHFSPIQKYCMLPELAGCETNLTTTANPNTSTTSSSTTMSTTSTTSSSPLDICKNKPDNTLLPHPNICSKFYICAHDDAIEKNCRSELHFSPTKLVCTSPEEAGCEGLQFCKNKTEEGEQMPNPRNCSTFYLCYHDDAKLKLCPNNLHFSPKVRACMLPELAGCDPNHKTTTTPSPTKPPTDICKGENDGQVFPYPYDCEKFYVCSNEEPKIKSCPTDLHFSPKLKYCTNPESAECEVNSTTTEELPTTTETSPSPGDICKEEKDGEVFPYPDDCGKFYICSENIANVKSCSTGLHFSPTEKYCMPPHLAGCDPPSPNDMCKNETDGTMFPYPEDCEKFWVCSNNVAKLKSCGQNFHFSPTKLYCMPPHLAGCDPNHNTTTTPNPTELPPPIDICKDQNDGEVFPYPDDCEKFYICFDKVANVKSCSPGLHFSPTEKYCMPPHLAGCDPPSPNDMCKNQTDGTMFPYPEDCEKFWVCSDQEKNLKSCGKNLHFSPTKLYCMLPELAGCDPNHNSTTTDSPPTVTDEPTTNPPITSTSDPTTEPPITITDDPSTKPPTTTTEKPPSGSCKGQPLGLNIKHPRDCTKYIVCIGGGVVRDCPSPLEFSEKDRVCDWPERAGCTITRHKNKKPIVFPTKSHRKTPPTKNKPVIINKESCKGVKFGTNVKHPSDCTKYIVCIDEGVEKNCPTPLEFHEKLGVCDWPERANCKG